MEGLLLPSVDSILKFTLLYSIRRNISYLIKYRSYLEELELRVRNLEVLSHNLERQVRNEAEIPAEVQLWLKDVADLLLEKEKLLELYSGRPLRRYKFSKEARKMIRKILILARGVHFDRISDLPASVDPNMLVQFESRMRTSRHIIRLLEDNSIGIVIVHGMSGVGKTTLAKEVGRYAVELGLFDVVVCSVVSQVPNVNRIQDEIADALGLRLGYQEGQLGRTFEFYQMLRCSDDSDERDVQVLIILDDVWSHLDIYEIGIPLSNYGVRCKVLLTSRNATPVDLPMAIVPVTTLSNEEAFLLFNQIVGKTVYSEYSDLAWEIVKTCEGLPLAIEAVAQELRGQPLSDWNLALQLLRRSITEFNSGILSSVKLSYDYLSDKDKFMFLLCSIFGEQIYHDDLLKYCWGLGLFEGADSVGEARSRVYNLMSLLKERYLLLEGRTSEYGKMHKIYRDFAIGVVSSDPDWFIVREDGWPIEWPEDENKMAKLTYVSLLFCNDMHQLPHEIIPESLPWHNLQRYNIMIGEDFQCSSEHEAFKVLKLNHNKGNIAGSKDWIESLLGSCEQLWLKEFKGSKNVLLESNGDQFRWLKHIHIQDNAELEYLPPELFIECCPLLKSVFNISAHECLFQLREMEISGCTNMVAVANNDRDDVKLVDGHPFFEGVPWDFGFPHLHDLTLKDLDNLNGFFTKVASSREIILAEANIYSGSLFLNLVVALPLMKHLKLINIPNIRHLIASTITDRRDQVVPLQNLETMEIIGCNDLCNLFVVEGSNIDENYGGLLPELRQLCLRNLGSFRGIIGDNHPWRILNFKTLNQLTVCNCNQLKYILSLHVPNNLKLQNIDVSDCAMLEQVFVYGDTEMAKSNSMVLPLLQSLKLSNLPKLASICFGSRHLISVQLYKCNSLKYVFPLSVARRLSSLQELKIISCARIGEIVTRETGSAAADTVEFPRLDTLILEKLPKFTRFCHSGCTVKWHSLEMVRVVECPKIEKSTLGKVDRPLLKSVEVIDCNPWENPHNLSNINYLFDLTDELADLTGLTIEDSEHLKRYMKMEIRDSSFAELKVLEARQCDTELTKFLSILLHRSHKLEKLTVENCKLLEQLFDLGGIDKGENRKFPNLNTMRLCDLPKLNCIWNEDASGIFHLGKLVKLEIINCGLLKNLVSTGFVENLVQLEELSIDSCEMIEEVVTFKVGEEKMEEQQVRSFPNLKNVELVSLPNFLKFKSGNYHFRFPNLLSLSIDHCPNMEAFTTGFLSAQAPSFNSGTSEHTRDDIMDVYPKLQILKLVGLDTFEEIWQQGLFSTKSFCELKELEAHTLGNLKYIFPSSMLPRLEKLETLVVNECSSLNNVFQLTHNMVIELPMLRNLILSRLPSLKHVVDKNSIMVLQNLEIIKVKCCDFLRHLLLPYSSCLKLKEIEISECKVLEEIFIDTQEEIRDGKAIRHLESLILENLPKLSHLPLENFEFPSLVEVRIVDCPLLNTYKPGNTEDVCCTADFFTNKDSFDKLKKLHLINVGGCQNIWNSDLSSSSPSRLKNTNVGESSTVSNKWWKLKKTTEQRSDGVDGKELLPVLDELVLSDLPSMQLWKQEPEIQVLRNLTSIEIIRCKSIQKLFSISVAENLDALELLKLYECESLQQVVQGGEKGEKQMFRNLKCLILKHLPSLTSFCKQKFDCEFTQLKMVRVENIPNMTTFIEGSLTTPKLKEVYVTHVTKCWRGDLNATINYLHQNQVFGY
ncbi:putative disease resistance protein [Senna tora]|uniref:Putative disease resistance protein n=1 Tax=Senna tora TaxID=362788 RepID=A0A834XHG3_9FABA|nr:putative disease resistance protein [Senna tora]